MRWPWKRRGVSPSEARESRQHLAAARAREPEVDYTIERRRQTKNRNGFGPLFEEGLRGGRG